jgi:hypothetical protein
MRRALLEAEVIQPCKREGMTSIFSTVQVHLQPNTLFLIARLVYKKWIH